MTQLDRIDRKILAELQADATIPLKMLAERVGLSQTPCWKRVQKLEDTGIITGRVALVNPEKIGLGLHVFVAVEASDHSPEWRDAFTAATHELPEVVEVYRMAGEMDYLLRVAVPDMAGYDAFYKRLTDRVALKNVTSHFSMERMKFSTAYPLDTESI